MLRFDFEVLLEIPEPEGGNNRAYCLGDPEICDLNEREIHDSVLDYTD